LGVWDILERRRQDGSIHSWGKKRGKNNFHLHVKGDEAPPQWNQESAPGFKYKER
jgi:hypothetical protein